MLLSKHRLQSHTWNIGNAVSILYKTAQDLFHGCGTNLYSPIWPRTIISSELTLPVCAPQSLRIFTFFFFFRRKIHVQFDLGRFPTDKKSEGELGSSIELSGLGTVSTVQCVRQLFIMIISAYPTVPSSTICLICRGTIVCIFWLNVLIFG